MIKCEHKYPVMTKDVDWCQDCGAYRWLNGDWQLPQSPALLPLDEERVDLEIHRYFDKGLRSEKPSNIRISFLAKAICAVFGTPAPVEWPEEHRILPMNGYKYCADCDRVFMEGVCPYNEAIRDCRAAVEKAKKGAGKCRS